MKLEKIAKKRLKWTALGIAGIYTLLMTIEAGTESYYIIRDRINSAQSYEAVCEYLSYHKGFPDVMKTFFLGTAVAHAINFVSNFGEMNFYDDLVAKKK